MNDQPLSKSDRIVITLLGVITTLLVLLLAGLGVGAYLALQEYHAIETALGAQSKALSGDLKAITATAGELSHEVTQRQTVLGEGLTGQSRLTLAKLQTLEARRASLAGVPKGPLEKLDRGIQLNQLTCDELLLLLTHLAETQATIGRRVAPLPAQKKVSP